MGPPRSSHRPQNREDHNFYSKNWNLLEDPHAFRRYIVYTHPFSVPSTFSRVSKHESEFIPTNANNTLPTHAGAGHQRTESTSTGGSHRLK